MKILINDKNLVPDDSWQNFRKVRAIIENDDGMVALSSEAGKYIFPGGKCDDDEDDLSAIQREIKEETGMIFSTSDFHEVLELETMYDDAIDYRTNMVRPRHTITKYYYVKTNQAINKDNMSLTEGEIKENFKIFFVDKETLFNLLKEEHKDAMNWKIFYEENQTIVNSVLKK